MAFLSLMDIYTFIKLTLIFLDGNEDYSFEFLPIVVASSYVVWTSIQFEVEIVDSIR